MYTLMIVDDEAAIREGMMNFNWERWGFQAAASAPNGRRALQEMARVPIDLVITDIRMPGMDGLTLCLEINKRYPGCVIIILSGYQDFEYAQSAIKAGVLDYLLKPVDMERSADIFLRAREELDRRARQRVFLEHAAPIALETLVSNILLGQTQVDADVSRALDALNVSVNAPGYGVTCLSIAGANSQMSRHAGISKEILSATGADSRMDWPAVQKQLLETGQFFFRCFVISVQHTFFVLNLLKTAESGEQRQQLLYQAAALQKATRPFLARDAQVFVGIGEPVSELSQVAKSRQQAAQLVRKAQFADEARVHAQWQNVKNRAEYPAELERGLIEAILAGDEARVSHLTPDLMGALLLHYYALPDTPFSSLAACFMRRVDQALGAQGLTWQKVGVDADYPAFLGRYAQFHSVSEVMLVKARALAALRTEVETTAFRAIQQTRRYIDEHYDKKITLGDMARRAYLNVSYFSVLFKKVTGKNFIDYLTEVRMKQAKRLLADPDVRVYAIGYQVGYPNPRYFSDSFRKYCGVSPLEYRNGLAIAKAAGFQSATEGE